MRADKWPESDTRIGNNAPLFVGWTASILVKLESWINKVTREVGGYREGRTPPAISVSLMSVLQAFSTSVE